MVHEDEDPKTHPCRASWREVYGNPDKAVDAIIWASRRWRRLEGVIGQAVAALDRNAGSAEVRAILAQVGYDQLKRIPAESPVHEGT